MEAKNITNDSDDKKNESSNESKSNNQKPKREIPEVKKSERLHLFEMKIEKSDRDNEHTCD